MDAKDSVILSFSKTAFFPSTDHPFVDRLSISRTYVAAKFLGATVDHFGDDDRAELRRSFRTMLSERSVDEDCSSARVACANALWAFGERDSHTLSLYLDDPILQSLIIKNLLETRSASFDGWTVLRSALTNILTDEINPVNENSIGLAIVRSDSEQKLAFIEYLRTSDSTDLVSLANLCSLYLDQIPHYALEWISDRVVTILESSDIPGQVGALLQLVALYDAVADKKGLAQVFAPVSSEFLDLLIDPPGNPNHAIDVQRIVASLVVALETRGLFDDACASYVAQRPLARLKELRLSLSSTDPRIVFERAKTLNALQVLTALDVLETPSAEGSE
ncbi:hypothetical protein HZC07_02750 [Candidatus Micrarchaeota archaeon]|nr:hypothetical protein [Candidatus Micrarchaeota archaeon]